MSPKSLVQFRDRVHRNPAEAVGVSVADCAGAGSQLASGVGREKIVLTHSHVDSLSRLAARIKWIDRLLAPCSTEMLHSASGGRRLLRKGIELIYP